MEPEDGDERGEWRSIPFDMSREEFQEYAYSGAAVRMRLPRRIGSTLVGFGDELDRNYDMEGNDVTLPLSHFVDHDQIDQPLFADALLNVRLCPSDDPTPSSPVTLIRVNPDAQPTVELFTCKPRAVAAGENSLLSWVTRQTEGVRVVIDPEVGDVGPVGTHEIAPLETGTYTLRLTAPGMEDVTEQVMVQVQPTRHSSSRAVAKVKRGGGGWRHGRGFSHSEVHAAGQATNFKLTRTVLCEKGKPVHKGTIVKMTSPANRIGQRLARLSYQGRHIVTCLANEVGRYGRVLSDSRKGTAAIKVDRRRRSKHPVNIRTLRKETND